MSNNCIPKIFITYCIIKLSTIDFPMEIIMPKDDQEIQNNGKQLPPQRAYSSWKNPFVLLLISLALAWIYLIMPNIDFFFYNLV